MAAQSRALADVVGVPEPRARISLSNEGRSRRDYNREYMREWRRRHADLVRERQREYTKRNYLRRKLAAVARASAEAAGRKLCGFGCGKAATETVERLDPVSFRPITVPYCGIC